MVFESLVVDIFNRFLGEYVVNLDSSQLKLGIWGGDATLRNLEIKENALSQFDIPFKVRAGHIGCLELKIPWKNLYTQSVEATLDGVYLLIVPTASIKYDGEKEEKQLQELRQRELQRIEETKLKLAEKENPQLQKQDTFVEKLVTQIIKNVQVKISNIHIRYEDDVTNPQCPMSFGVCLSNLSLQTCDEDWNPTVLDENARLFYKLVQLDKLFAYCNVTSVLFSNHSSGDALLRLQSSLDVNGSYPSDHNFILRPISAGAKLCMNPRSDVDFSSPKVDLMVSISEVAIELNRPQYISILELLGSVDLLSRNLPYRKYRPEVSVHSNANIWWNYAITSVLEVDVKPRLHMWSWTHIKQHRKMVKHYRELYKVKITSKKPSEMLLKQLQEPEKTLDIFNITLARQQAEVEASKGGLRIYRQGLKMEEEESQGWVSWMWNWGSDPETKTKEVKSTGGFDDLLTPDEKSRLYAAIGYSETAANSIYPKDFEDMKVDFHMPKLTVSIKEKKDKDEIVKLTVGELMSSLTQRSGAQAIKFTAKLSLFEITGLVNRRAAPTLLSSKTGGTGMGTPLLSLFFETNPLDQSANQRLYVESEPLEIIYDAMTVNAMSAFFRPPDDLELDELTNATLIKLEQFRDRTATGLMYVIETQKVLDLKVNLLASYVIIPQTGFYDGTQNILLLDLGHLQMSSQSKKHLPQLYAGSSSIEDIMLRAYDSFNIQLSNLQFLYSKPMEDWKEARMRTFSPLHILEPVDLIMEFSRAMVVKDSRMPKYKLSGELPMLSLSISDVKLRNVLKLVDSIPLPQSSAVPRNAGVPPPAKPKQFRQLSTRRHLQLADQRSSLIFESCETLSLTSLGSEEDLFYDAPTSPITGNQFFADTPMPLRYADLHRQKNISQEERQKNMTDFLMSFEISKFSVKLCRLDDSGEEVEEEVVVLQLDVQGLGTELRLCTFNMACNTYLREICLMCPEYKISESKKVQLITTLDNSEVDMLTLEYIRADKNGPEFKSLHNNTEQLIKVSFSSLDINLHTKALLSTMNYIDSLLLKPTEQEEIPGEHFAIPEEEGKKEGTAAAKRKTQRKNRGATVINLHIRADLRSLKVFIRGEKAMISEIKIEGLFSEVLMRKSEMKLMANLKNIIVFDCDETALYRKAVSIADKEVFAFQMVNYTDATKGDAYLNMSQVDTSVTLTVGCIQFVFLNKFISSILAFINNFHEAKNALAEVTQQAAEKAASGVKELSERSTRIALNVHFKAPIIFVPQSSSCHNVLVADLGFLSIKNHFAIQPSEIQCKIPPVVDIMEVKLTDLKMYRSIFVDGELCGARNILQPVSLEVEVQRNLSSNWYKSIPDMEINAHLMPLSLTLSQEDMVVVLKTLYQNLGENSDTATPRRPTEDSMLDVELHGSGTSERTNSNTVVTTAVVENQNNIKLTTTMKIHLKIDSMALVLFKPNENELSILEPHDDELKLGEFTLGTSATAVTMYSDSSMKATVQLHTCLLDDKRPNIQTINPRMMGMRPGTEDNMMVQVTYRQSHEGTTLDTVVQDVYLCASMEFLLTVVDIFLGATKEGFAGTPQSKPTPVPEDKNNTPAPPKEQIPISKMEMNIVVRNPEIVFVADLTLADGLALVMTTQCELAIKNDVESSKITAVIQDLKVVACPFLREKRAHNVTTILQPCQVFFQSFQTPSSPQAMEISMNSLSLKVSPIIIKTFISIQSALTPATETVENLESPVPVDMWSKRDWKDLKLWFLEEQGEANTKSAPLLVPKGESLKLDIKSICITLEAGVGHHTVPMLLAKSSFQGDVKNWSTLINLNSELNLEVHYYNEVVGVWEPLLEPLEDDSTDGFRPWRLEFKMKTKPLKNVSWGDEVDNNVPDYMTVIEISSKDQLNITLSKCALTMLGNLGTAFAEAAKETRGCFQKEEAPFLVKNRLGLPISVKYSNMLSPIATLANDHTVELHDGQTLGMDYSVTTDSDQFSAMTSLSEKDFYIQPTPAGHTSASPIPLIKVERKMYSVVHEVSGVTRFLVCQIYSVQSSKYIKIRSPFQIINHFFIPFKVLEGSTHVGTSLPTEEFCVPLDSYRSELSLQPVTADENEQFECSECFSYDDINLQKPKMCRSSGNRGSVLTVNIVPVKDEVTFKDMGNVGNNFDVPVVIHLWPCVLLRNLLPYTITYKLHDSSKSSLEFTLDPGHSAQLHTAIINESSLHLCLNDYLDQTWSAKYSLCSEWEEITFITFKSVRTEEDDNFGEGPESRQAELDIAVHVEYEHGQIAVAIYSPYWMVNKTGRLLQYKADDIHRKHPLNYDMPLLFSFKPRYFLKNNKVRLMIFDSELSDEFSLDTVGSYGDVKCKGQYKDYLVGVQIDTSSFSLTRMVTFMPFYTLINRTKETIFVCEEGQERWTEVPPEQFAIPFWPENDAKLLKVKMEGLSQHRTINFTNQENGLLLRTLGGIIVDINVSEHSSTIRFSEYHDGAAPFLIINHTKDQVLEFYQSVKAESPWVPNELLDFTFSEEAEASSQKLTELEEVEAEKAVFYTWTEPTGSRELCWRCGKYSGKLKSEEDLREDIGKEGKLFIISFYEGLQRVVLFTEELRIYKLLCESEKAQLVKQEIILSLDNVGVSLVNNNSSQEVSFIGITSSDVIWELKPKKKSRWKPLGCQAAEMLEKCFKEYLQSGTVDKAIVDLDNGFQVCLSPNDTDMQILQPCDAPLRRHFLPAVKVAYSVSPRQSTYRIQIHNIQIQNQLPGAIFPYVFYPVKLPKSITMDAEPKPLTDISIVTRAAGHSDISRIKYFKVLIQEMDLKLDLGFLYAILDLFSSEDANDSSIKQEVELFQKDLEYLKTELNDASTADTTPISLYEYFHISPIKLHLSFSLSTGGEDGLKEKRERELIPVQSLNLLLKSIGATLTDVQDVVFKLAFFELNFRFCTTQQLQSEVIRHYSKQAIKQMYVLVLGLDVLGNPFGLIRGLSAGVEALFYEPYQGAIQGPEEFVEGMALGVKALVGGAVGGIAGAASRITGAMAKGVAAITMDEEYQQKRRDAMNTQPSSFKEGLTRGGKGLVSGFVSGITGIVTQPIAGAQREGAAGFFKGVGKGLVGAVARPTGGIIDMASSTFQGIKRAAETSQDIESLRPPRFIHEDGVIRPYKQREGIGSQMLQKIENGRFAKYRYFAHAKVNDSDFLMITKRGIFFVTTGTFGQLICEWQYLFDEFTKEPTIVESRRLRIEAKERVKSVFHAKEFGKIINFKTPEIAKWVLTKLEDARDTLPKY
ncbi:intermembrane lipid transfer protein VPS13A isoform X1 [Stigmatopora argus]